MQSTRSGSPNSAFQLKFTQMEEKKEWYSRIRDSVLMVDANGKKYNSSHINNMVDKQEDWGAEQQYEDIHVGAIANLTLYNHLNW